MTMREKGDCLNKKTDNENKHMLIIIAKQVKVWWVELYDPSDSKIFVAFPKIVLVEQDIRGWNMKRYGQVKMLFDFTSLLLTQKYHSPGIINKFALDYYIASKKRKKMPTQSTSLWIACLIKWELKHNLNLIW